MSTEESKDLKSSAKRQASIIHASQTGASSKKTAKPKDASDYVKMTKAVLDFAILTLMAQKQLIEDLSNMSDDEKMETLFYLLDKDSDGAVDAVELADGLRKVRGDVNFEESLAVAVERVLQFDQEGKGKLTLEDFKTYVETLAETLGTNFHEISELLVMQVLFSESGNSDLENLAGALVSEEVTEAIKEEEEAQNVMSDVRMKALFMLFDADGSGSVDFKEVVLGMFKITEDIEGSSKAAIMALLLFDEDSSRSLDYEQFARFMIQVVAAAPEHLTFDDIADSMTLLAAQDIEMTSEEIAALYELNQDVQQILALKETSEALAEVTESQLKKSNSLFYLWDMDEDGKLDLKELILGLRKFEQTESMKSTVEEAFGLMDAYDVDGDHTLDPAEFCLFMVEFAKLAGTDLDDTLDFMIVQSAMQENSEAEVKYLKALSEGDVSHL